MLLQFNPTIVVLISVDLNKIYLKEMSIKIVLRMKGMHLYSLAMNMANMTKCKS